MYLADVDLGLLGDPIESSLSLFLLDFEGDALDGSALDTLDEVGSESCDFVAETLGGDLGDLREDLLVDVEVVGQLLVVLLEQDLGGSLHGFGSDSSHLGL
jgi:hypothetical protein